MAVLSGVDGSELRAARLRERRIEACRREEDGRAGGAERRRALREVFFANSGATGFAMGTSHINHIAATLTPRPIELSAPATKVTKKDREGGEVVIIGMSLSFRSNR